jgi:predicted dehydrogenase
MRVGIIGTGAIACKHAQAYKNIGYQVTACTNTGTEKGHKFADAMGAEFLATPKLLCQHPRVDFIDVCTPPSYRLAAVELCAGNGKIAFEAASGASDPMAISVTPFERQLLDFGESCEAGRSPACSGLDGFLALQPVRSINTSCAEARRVGIVPAVF